MTARPWERAPSGALAERAAAFAALVPVLETARLCLRAPRIGDFEIYLSTATDRPEDRPSDESREAVWLDFCQMHASWMQRGFGPWTITARATGAAIGFLPVDHEFGDPEPEIGWFVSPAWRRRGVAVEAARLALDHGLPALGFTSIVSYVDRDNAASVAVAKALGGVLDPGAHPDDRVIVHRHLTPGTAP